MLGTANAYSPPWICELSFSQQEILPESSIRASACYHRAEGTPRGEPISTGYITKSRDESAGPHCVTQEQWNEILEKPGD